MNMKAIIKRADLQGALKSALALHSEGGFLFEPGYFIAMRKTGAAELTVDLNDNTSQMAIRIPAELSDWPMDAGTCIPKKEGKNFLQFGNSEWLTVQPSTNDVALQSGKSRMSIKTIPLDKFNLLDYVPSSEFLEVPSANLRSILEFTVGCFASAKNGEQLPVHLETDADGSTQVMCSDGVRISHAYLTDVQMSLEAHQLKHTIAIRTANFLAKFLKDMPGETPVRVYGDEGFLSFTSEDWSFRTQVLAADALPWQRVVHADGVSACSANPEQFNDAIGEAMSISDTRPGVVKIDMGKEEIVCSNHSGKGLAKGVFDAKVETFVQFNLSADSAQNYLSGLLKAGGATVEVEQIGLKTPGLVRLVNRTVPMKPSITTAQYVAQQE
jgi:alkylated DNA nucleotide flippase Atl1